jgi:hypothetical protein
MESVLTTMRWHLVILFAFIVFAGLATAAPLQIDAINQAQLHRPLPAKERINPAIGQWSMARVVASVRQYD